jgi:hypothetical protein
MIKELNLNKDLRKFDAVLCVCSGACTGNAAKFVEKIPQEE